MELLPFVQKSNYVWGFLKNREQGKLVSLTTTKKQGIHLHTKACPPYLCDSRSGNYPTKIQHSFQPIAIG